jgi:hypothetical protein
VAASQFFSISPSKKEKKKEVDMTTNLKEKTATNVMYIA